MYLQELLEVVDPPHLGAALLGGVRHAFLPGVLRPPVPARPSPAQTDSPSRVAGGGCRSTRQCCSRRGPFRRWMGWRTAPSRSGPPKSSWDAELLLAGRLLQDIRKLDEAVALMTEHAESDHDRVSHIVRQCRGFFAAWEDLRCRAQRDGALFQELDRALREAEAARAELRRLAGTRLPGAAVVKERAAATRRRRPSHLGVQPQLPDAATKTSTAPAEPAQGSLRQPPQRSPHLHWASRCRRCGRRGWQPFHSPTSWGCSPHPSRGWWGHRPRTWLLTHKDAQASPEASVAATPIAQTCATEGTPRPRSKLAFGFVESTPGPSAGPALKMRCNPSERRAVQRGTRMRKERRPRRRTSRQNPAEEGNSGERVALSSVHTLHRVTSVPLEALSASTSSDPDGRRQPLAGAILLEAEVPLEAVEAPPGDEVDRGLRPRRTEPDSDSDPPSSVS
ncbi:hypothetical protein Esti_001147 [Eimeria stiedai]